MPPRTHVLLSGLVLAVVALALWGFLGRGFLPQVETAAAGRAGAAQRRVEVGAAANALAVQRAPVVAKAERRAATAATTGGLELVVRWRDSGAPAAVAFQLSLESAPTATRRVVRTGADGRCRVDALIPGHWQLTRDIHGNRTLQIEAGRATEVRMDLPPGPSASGVVVWADGRPAAGAEVQWLGDSLKGAKSHCDVEGRFSLKGLPSNYSIAALLDGAAAESGYQSLVNQGEHREFRLVLSQPKAAVPQDIAGRLLISLRTVDGTTLEGPTRVQGGVTPVGLDRAAYFVDGELAGLETMQGNEVELSGLAPGSVSIAVDHPGFVPVQCTAQITPVQLTRVEVTLRRGARIRGTVRTADGTPVYGVHVSVRPAVHPSPRGPRPLKSTGPVTDARGRYDVDALPEGEYRLEVRSSVHGLARHEVEVAAEATAVWDAVLDAGSTIRGRVEDERGEPLAGWVVKGYGRVHWVGPVRSAADGSFRLVQCRPGCRYDVQVYEPVRRFDSVPRAYRQDVEPDTAGVVVRVADSSEPSAWLRGQLLAPDGRPPEGVKVWVYQVAHTWNFIYPVSASDGRFEVGPLPPGQYRLESAQFGVHTYPDLKMGTYDLPAGGRVEVGTHHLRRACAVSIEVVRRGFEGPLGGAILDGETRAYVANVRIAKDRVELSSAIGAGAYLLCLEGTGLVPVCMPFACKLDVPTRLRVTLQRAASVLVRFASLPERAEQVLVEVFEAGSGRRVATSIRYRISANCSWEFGLPPGRYRVRASFEGEEFAAEEFAMGDRNARVVPRPR